METKNKKMSRTQIEKLFNQLIEEVKKRKETMGQDTVDHFVDKLALTRSFLLNN